MTARAVTGVDPGGTTGITTVQYTLERGYWIANHFGVSALPNQAVRIVDKHMTDAFSYGADLWALAVERFVVGRRAGRSSSAQAGALARDIIGALEAAYPGQIYRATASEAKTWASDRRLKAAGLAPTQGLPHTRDAARHALFTLHKRYGCPDPLSASYRPGGTDD
jgi:hypothetical protein